MTPTGVLLVTPIFRRGSGSLSLLQGPSRVALALHKARCGTPLGVTIRCNNKLTDEQFICLSPWVRFPCPLRVCGQQRRGASGCQRQCCAALALAVHGMQGASCPEALTCHVEFSPPPRPCFWSTRACRVGGVLAGAPARQGILAEGAIALLVTLSGSALFAS